jgi:hypothetical protein
MKIKKLFKKYSSSSDKLVREIIYDKVSDKYKDPFSFIAFFLYQS